MKILKEKKVRSYELTFLVPASLTTATITAAHTAVMELIKKHGFTVATQEDWGKKELAYPIRFNGQNEREALYTHVVFEADAAQVPAFEKDLYLQQSVVRHLLVLAEDAGTPIEAFKAVKEDHYSHN